ncbi:MAG: hypothetical protein CEE43_11230 [Promethearchaeota archaeon Loki_b32]|nr:MAG: hypothetical protein CEE43_11230 [Candidatus Lokiarchaeota archaeon Loki_b32]
MVTISRKKLVVELKKRGWEQYLTFAVEEIKNGTTLRDVFKAIANKDEEVFIEDLTNPKKIYLPKSFIQGETEIKLNSKEKIEGYIEVKGDIKITPKCYTGQRPYRKNNILGCTNEPEENIE